VLALEAIRPRGPPPDPNLLPFVFMMGVSLVMFVAIIGLVFWVISVRGKEVRARAEAAFGHLGIGGSRFITMSWRGRGSWQGRGVTVTVMAGQSRSPASMFIELAAATRFDLTIGPPIGATGRWLRDKLSKGLDIATPDVPGVSLYTNDPSRGTTTAGGAATSIRRIMTAQTPGQQRYVFVRAGVVKLHVIGDAWQALTAQSARADLDDLVAIAQNAERY
jgi:hypothetical protein